MKKLKLKRMGVVQTANVCALLYVPLGLIYLILGFVMYQFFGDMVGGITLMIMGGLLPLLGWVMVAIMTLLVNLAYIITGGITLTFEEEPENK